MSNGIVDAYIGIQNEKDPYIRELKKKLYKELVEAGLLEPINIEDAKACRKLNKEVGRLTEEQFNKLLNIIENIDKL